MRKISNYVSVQLALFDLHWLPIKARISVKILTTMFNCGTALATAYLIALLSKSVNRRQGLKSTNDPGIRYGIPINKKTRFNDRSFCTIGPNLPLFIKQSVSIDVYKTNLNTDYLDSFMTCFKIDSHVFNAFSALELLYLFKHLLRPIMVFIYRTHRLRQSFLICFMFQVLISYCLAAVHCFISIYVQIMC